MNAHPDIMIAEVVVVAPVDHPFSYLIPEEFTELVRPGVQVIVPLGNRLTGGVVWKVQRLKSLPEKELKPIKDVVDTQPFLPEDLRVLLEWMASYYVCHLGEVIRLVNPNRNLKKAFWEVRKLTPSLEKINLTGALSDIYSRLQPDRWTSLQKIEQGINRKNILHYIQRLKERGLVETRYHQPQLKAVFKKNRWVQLNPVENWTKAAREKYSNEADVRQQKALQIIRFVREHAEVSVEDIVAQGLSKHSLRRLISEQVLTVVEKIKYREQDNAYAEQQAEVTLTREQSDCLQEILPFLPPTNQFQPFLLHGITGSGKTQIYIELIQHTIQNGFQVIVLIPEIVLTPQTMARFTHFFKERVAVIHSRLSEGERNEILFRIRQGAYDVVVGPRSAILAPLNKLGLIIVDEEHESSYKQTDAIPRYNARDVALYRGHLNRIPVVLGSATPSFESLQNARLGKYRYFHLSKRISSRNLPRTMLVDLKEEWRKMQEPPILSEHLMLKIESRLVSREQIMLLQNRRGFSPYILCKDCGYIAQCPNCDITLTYHSLNPHLRCHYCGHQERAPDVCPRCSGFDIIFKGIGTQKIEQEVLRHFPHARVLRMDQDTTRGRHDHARILEKFRNGDADILIGTKMIAKGLDFHRVTLVGIISADQGLHFPDFRAAEKVFQLLTQAAGRAGRGASSGEVVIQSFDPKHYIFKYLGTHDYLKFFEKEIKSRELLKYPPFSRLCLIRIVGEDEETVRIYGEKVARFLWQANSSRRFNILGPAPAPLFKIRNLYRYHVLIKQDKTQDAGAMFLRKLLKEGLYKNPKMKKWPVKVHIDMDPLEIL